MTREMTRLIYEQPELILQEVLVEAGFAFSNPGQGNSGGNAGDGDYGDFEATDPDY